MFVTRVNASHISFRNALYHKSYKEAINSPVDQVVYYPPLFPVYIFTSRSSSSKNSPKAGSTWGQSSENDVLGLIMTAIWDSSKVFFIK
jgi:hypothetical protein